MCLPSEHFEYGSPRSDSRPSSLTPVPNFQLVVIIRSLDPFFDRSQTKVLDGGKKSYAREHEIVESRL